MRREQVFWGWGEPGAGPTLPDHAVTLLRDELGISGDVVSSPVDTPAVPPSALSASLRERLASVAEVRDDDEVRVLRTRGKSYLDLLAQRAGDLASAPDAVVAPADAAGGGAAQGAWAGGGGPGGPLGGGARVRGGRGGGRPHGVRLPG